MAINEEAIEQYYTLSQQIKSLTEQKDKLNEQIKEVVAPGKHQSGEFAIDLQNVNIGINKPLFSRDYPEDEFPELYERVPSTEKIKRFLSKEEIDDYSRKTARLTISKRNPE